MIFYLRVKRPNNTIEWYRREKQRFFPFNSVFPNTKFEKIVTANNKAIEWPIYSHGKNTYYAKQVICTLNEVVCEYIEDLDLPDVLDFFLGKLLKSNAYRCGNLFLTKEQLLDLNWVQLPPKTKILDTYEVPDHDYGTEEYNRFKQYILENNQKETEKYETYLKEQEKSKKELEEYDNNNKLVKSEEKPQEQITRRGFLKRFFGIWW